MSTSKLLLRRVTIHDSHSRFDGQIKDILIKNGKIEAIKSKIEPPNATKVLDVKGACVSVGWIDVGVQTGDPGYEHRENLQSVSAAAAAGGFTSIIAQPNTEPAIHSKSEVLYLQNRTQNNLVDILPIGAISRDAQGEDLTEMVDMHHSGAIAFSDGKYPIQNAGLMLRALQYVKTFNGLIINHPQDDSISKDAQIHEGYYSTILGMRGFPAIAEELMLQRDIELLAYTNSRLHVSNISTAGSIQKLKRAKENQLNISASTTILNLIFEDKDMTTFDTSLKVLPPLRETTDRNALIKALKKGTLDYLSSNHIPLEEETKLVEFPYAKFGAIGLQTLYPLLQTHLSQHFSTSEIVKLLSLRPRQIFNIDIPKIAVQAKANLTVFAPEEKWTYTKSNNKSKSINSPILNQELKGKVLAVVNNGKHQLF